MAHEVKQSQYARKGYYVVTYYCYADDCPARTKDKPWPKSDGEFKWAKVTSRKENIYRRKRWVCKHCGRVMTGTVSMYDFDG